MLIFHLKLHSLSRNLLENVFILNSYGIGNELSELFFKISQLFYFSRHVREIYKKWGWEFRKKIYLFYYPKKKL